MVFTPHWANIRLKQFWEALVHSCLCSTSSLAGYSWSACNSLLGPMLKVQATCWCATFPLEPIAPWSRRKHQSWVSLPKFVLQRWDEITSHWHKIHHIRLANPDRSRCLLLVTAKFLHISALLKISLFSSLFLFFKWKKKRPKSRKRSKSEPDWSCSSHRHSGI